MPVQPVTTLPSEWEARETSDGGTELRIRQNRRGCLISVPLILVLLIAVRAVLRWPLANDQMGWSIGISVVFILFAIWCACAREYWRMGTGYIEHHVHFGVWQRVRRYQNAALEIETGTTNDGVPYYHLIAIEDGKRHFLFSRSMDETVLLARYISARTGFKTS